MKHSFTFFEALIPGVDGDNLHMVTAGFVGFLLILVSVFLYPRFRKVYDDVVPSRRVGVQNIFEITIELLAGLCRDIIGPNGNQYLPFVGSIFFFLLGANLIGLVPGFLPPTENWVTGAAIATIVFITYNVFGFQAHGIRYVGHFFVPISLSEVKNIFAWICIMIPLVLFQALFGTLEIVSSLVRPVTLSFRLFVNITADHLLLNVFSGLVPYLIPIPFLLFGLFVSFMQAFIFTLLTMVYISIAVASNH